MGASCSSDRDAPPKATHRRRRKKSTIASGRHNVTVSAATPHTKPTDAPEHTDPPSAAFDALCAPPLASEAPEFSDGRRPAPADRSCSTRSATTEQPRPQLAVGSGAISNVLAPHAASIAESASGRTPSSSLTACPKNRGISSVRTASTCGSSGTRTTSSGVRFVTASAFFYGTAVAAPTATPASAE